MYIARSIVEKIVDTLMKNPNAYTLDSVVNALDSSLADDDRYIERQRKTHEEKMATLRKVIYNQVKRAPHSTVTELQYALMDELNRPSMCKISGNLMQMLTQPDRYPRLTKVCTDGRIEFYIEGD